MEPNTKNLDDLSHSDWNPRKISDHDFEALKKSMLEFGDLSGVVKNLETGTLVGGNQRLDAFRQLQAPRIVLTHTYIQPTPVGTVAVGYIELPNGERFGYREVRWPLAREKAANIAANRIQGEFDRDLLAKVTAELKDLDPKLLDLTGQTLEEIDELLDGAGVQGQDENLYTKEIQSPTYEPSAEKPDINLLVNEAKTRNLLSAIEASGLDEAEKTFLRIAAHRHSIFNYSKIADYYAHASPEMQKLMEDSALVIIDFNKAIELGYVEFTKEIMDIQKEDYPEDEQ